jgi:lipopolysaccharide biosynthesis protein
VAVRRVLKGLYWAVTFQLPRKLRERRAAADLRESGLFDEGFYRELYPEITAQGLDPVVHYVRHGASEGRLANPLFDPDFYRTHHPDVAQRRIEPLLHFVRWGAREGRSPHPWFDTPFYLRSNPFLAETDLNPLAHYLRLGARTGRDPHPAFDNDWYLATYPQIAASGLNPLVHFVRWGGALGFQPHAEGTRKWPGPPGEAPPRRGEHPTVAVVLHLYYPDLWDEICHYLGSLGTAYDLYVSLCWDTGAEVYDRIRATHPEAVIRYVENRGRDIAPLLAFLQDGSLSPYELVCKIHSKKSPHRTDGDRWRGNLLHQMLGAPEIVREIRDVFDQDPSVGMLGPANHLDRSEESWGSNRERMRELARRIGGAEAEPSLEFFAGSMFWFRPAALAPLVALGLQPGDFEEERGQLDGALHHAIERSFPMVVRAAGYDIHPFVRPAHAARAGTQVGGRRVKLIAFYLPQFHPIAENDEWWGTGFTEWANVARARPLYEGHPQPRLPKDLGFYDLRVPETRRAQADLARRYGLHGFCYYYYWFDGRRLLERPLEEMLQSGDPDFPFCICWANENWTRRWDGLENEILIRQSYSLDSSRRFIRDVIPILRDPRYVRFEGRPVLVVYRARHIPQIEETVEMWRRECRIAGLGEIHLCAVRFWDIVDVQALGFDAAIDFPPHHIQVRDVSREVRGLAPDFDGLLYDYQHAARENLATCGQGYEKPAHRGVMLAWDNTARRGSSAHIAHGASPDAYGEWLRGVLEQEMAHNPREESLVFINAWNEWGEGATLEPDQHFGLGFLEATRDALRDIVERHRKGVR